MFIQRVELRVSLEKTGYDHFPFFAVFWWQNMIKIVASRVTQALFLASNSATAILHDPWITAHPENEPAVTESRLLQVINGWQRQLRLTWHNFIAAPAVTHAFGNKGVETTTHVIFKQAIDRVVQRQCGRSSQRDAISRSLDAVCLFCSRAIAGSR